jgi:hypothetical protein
VRLHGLASRESEEGKTSHTATISDDLASPPPRADVDSAPHDLRTQDTAQNSSRTSPRLPALGFNFGGDLIIRQIIEPLPALFRVVTGAGAELA